MSLIQRHLLKISRVEGLTDGVFAIAMTILVLDLRLPSNLQVHNLFYVLQTQIIFKLYIYIASFILLGTLWVAMIFQLGLIDRLNREYLWANIFYLMVVCVVPFSATLVAAHPNNPASISFYAMNLLCTSLGQFLVYSCARFYKLNDAELYTDAIAAAVVHRILVAPVFYIAALILAYWHPNIAFILLIIPTVVYMIPGKIDRYEQPRKNH